uniref:Ig-like domain-containing protein n=1 Tax=Cyprinus carpio TaxID=7962 RepID=A0A8C2FUY5_CYPCA
MADKRHMRRLGLIILCSFLTGTFGVDDIHKFCSSGENVRLPCNNALSGCTSTTWTYTRHSEEVELIAEGEKKNDIERHERLSLGSDCSLNIKNVTKEDYGFYICKQYVNEQEYGSVTRVYLHFLHVSPSSTQSEIRPGSFLTLFCQLYIDGDSCDSLVRTDGVQLIWVNQAGANLQTDSRYQILFSSVHCISTLTTTLLDEDHNREWRCQVTQRNEVKTSAAYIVRYPDTSTNSPESHKQVTVIVISAVTAAFAVALVSVLWVFCKKRADHKRGTDSSVVKDRNQHKGTYETINMSIPTMPNANEEKDDVTYSEVTTSSKNRVQMDYNNSIDTVTYAVIRGTEYAPQDGLYSSVNTTTTPHK